MSLLFVKLLHVPWPPSLLGDFLPELRDLSGRLIGAAGRPDNAAGGPRGARAAALRFLRKTI